jgi:hypothetical protein
MIPLYIYLHINFTAKCVIQFLHYSIQYLHTHPTNQHQQLPMITLHYICSNIKFTANLCTFLCSINIPTQQINISCKQVPELGNSI